MSAVAMSAELLYERPRPKNRRDAHLTEWVVVLRSSGGSRIEHKRFDDEQDARAFAAEHGYQEETA